MDIKQRNANLKEFFDRKAEGYDGVHARFECSKRMLAEALNDDTKNILDLGAGTGMELFWVFERFENANVLAVDLSKNMLDGLLQKPFADRVKAVCGDFFEVDFGKDLDAVISTSSLHHFDGENKLVLYKKVYDCLKDGGVFANSDKVADNSDIQEEWLGYWENSPDKMHHIDTPLTVENEARLLKMAGFRDVKAVPTPNEDYVMTVAVK